MSVISFLTVNFNYSKMEECKEILEHSENVNSCFTHLNSIEKCVEVCLNLWKQEAALFLLQIAM